MSLLNSLVPFYQPLLGSTPRSTMPHDWGMRTSELHWALRGNCSASGGYLPVPVVLRIYCHQFHAHYLPSLKSCFWTGRGEIKGHGLYALSIIDAIFVHCCAWDSKCDSFVALPAFSDWVCMTLDPRVWKCGGNIYWELLLPVSFFSLEINWKSPFSVALHYCN